MRQMSALRRKVVVMAASVSLLSAMNVLILPRHLPARWEWVRWAWLGLVVMLLVRVFVLMTRLKREEG